MFSGYPLGNSGGGLPMSVLQQQQMRAHGGNMMSGNLQQSPMGGNQGNLVQAGGHMPSQQLNIPMNQQLLSHVQQQNLLQQNTSQVCKKYFTFIYYCFIQYCVIMLF